MPTTTQKKGSNKVVITIVVIMFLGLLGIGAYAFKFFGANELEKSEQPKSAKQPVKEGPKYVKLEDVQLHLDCDNSLENGEKAELLRKKYQGTRLTFSELVRDRRSNTEYVLSGWIGEGTSISKFNCLPHVILSSENKTQIEVDKAYEFDCRVTDFCEEGTILDGQLRFDDCKVLKTIK